MMSLPGREQRALERIEHRLAGEDPVLGSRFAFFTMLTQDEAMPPAEQLRCGRQRARRRTVLLPLLAIGLAALLIATGLIPSRQACPVDPNAAASALSSPSHAARCPGPAINTMPVH
jgi:hypothetical protein